MRKRKKYSDEFKQQAIELAQSGIPVAQVERDLGITTNLLSRWIREANRPQAEIDTEKRLKELEKENAKLRRERDILKKAMAIFSEDQ